MRCGLGREVVDFDKELKDERADLRMRRHKRPERSSQCPANLPRLNAQSCQILAAPEVQKVVELEAWLMEGSYNRALAAKDSLVDIRHSSYFLSKLADTVRCAGMGLAWGAVCCMPNVCGDMTCTLHAFAPPQRGGRGLQPARVWFPLDGRGPGGASSGLASAAGGDGRHARLGDQGWPRRFRGRGGRGRGGGRARSQRFPARL